MMRKHLILTLLLLLTPAEALAWGVEGHEIIAHIAARQLSPRARAEVSALLGGDAEGAMVTAANWADEIRDARPETGRWHYVNIELNTAGYDHARDCPRDDCVVSQIDSNLAIAANRRLPGDRRAEALRFLIHLVGDIHQPLHVIDNHDRGGNDIRVKLGRKFSNMHQVWDTRVVEFGLSEDAGRAADRIMAAFPRQVTASWQSGTAAAWADESFQLARRDIYAELPPGAAYGRPIKLPNGYLDREAGDARRQLAKAGTRLAWLLNTAFR